MVDTLRLVADYRWALVTKWHNAKMSYSNEPFSAEASTVTDKPAVLVICFNRVDTLHAVLSAVRQYSPERLYIFVDGPRIGYDSDTANIRAVRELIGSFCFRGEVRIKVMPKNLGCGLGPATAISWFFENEAEGIILEDDCVPTQAFFSFCSAGLEKYRDVKQVWQISGNNFIAPSGYFGDHTAAFCSLAQVWGWATWRDRWQNYEFDHRELISKHHCSPSHWNLSAIAKTLKRHHVETLAGRSDVWDYQWQATVLGNRGLVLVPRFNLVTNIGDGTTATHTKRDRRTHLPVVDTGTWRDIDALRLPDTIVGNRRLTVYFERHMGLRSVRSWLRVKLKAVAQSISAISK